MKFVKKWEEIRTTIKKAVSVGLALSILTLLLFLATPIFAAESYKKETEKKNITLTSGKIKSSGYIEAFFYPPHNEYDSNQGIEFKDRIVARYGIEMYTEVRYKDFFLFAHPFAVFGDSRPQIDYNYKADPIVAHFKFGGGYNLRKDLELRITGSKWKDLGGQVAKKQSYWNSISLRYAW